MGKVFLGKSWETRWQNNKLKKSNEKNKPKCLMCVCFFSGKIFYFQNQLTSNETYDKISNIKSEMIRVLRI